MLSSTTSLQDETGPHAIVDEVESCVVNVVEPTPTLKFSEALEREPGLVVTKTSESVPWARGALMQLPERVGVKSPALLMTSELAQRRARTW
jgi:hypothetical protein